jgi:CheY-like chemotaxis protein
MDLIVYYADDNVNDRELFKNCLNTTNPDAYLFLFRNGDELMDHLNNTPLFFPDIIFLDINMPGKTDSNVYLK